MPVYLWMQQPPVAPIDAARLQWEVILLGAGAVILLAATIYLAVWVGRGLGARRRATEDDEPTEVQADAYWRSPEAYLLAQEEYNNAPAQIELYAGAKITVGRNGSECTVQINDIGISRRHAEFIARNGHFYVSDSGSLGGTFLYRKNAGPHERQDRPRLAAREERRLRDGDLVKFYTFAYRFQEGDATIAQDEHETQSTG